MADAHAEVLAQLTALEPIFHRFEHLEGGVPSRADLEAITSPAFFEIGASGRLYTRDSIFQTVEERFRSPSTEPDLWNTSGFRLLQLSPETWLLSYHLEQQLPSGPRLSRRTTLWRRTPQGWQILFHQGTLIENPVKPLQASTHPE